MALIPRKKKVKDDPVQTDDTIMVQWKVYNNRESFALMLNEEDISERTTVYLTDEGDMVVFDPEVGIYFLLKDIDNVPEDEWQNALGHFAEDGVAIISQNNLENYYCFYEGENVSQNTEGFRIADDFCVWIPEDEDYYFLTYSQQQVDDEILIPKPLEIDNGALWYKDGEGSFWLYVQGIAIASHARNAWVGDDLLVYDYENDEWYYLVDYETATPLGLYKAAILPVQGKNLWTRTSDENHYMFYKEGNNISKDTRALTFDDDMIVFVDEDNSHYLMENFQNVVKYNLYEPILLPNNTDAIWRKPNNEEFYLYVRGHNISSEVTSRLMDGNLLCLHRPTKIIYICTDFKENPIGEFLPAATMEAGKFMHYFD
ncbi:MAG: hypothetical protein JW794_01945 [Candidatus Cloacimonetes bacterium]|nr:hypothetical protein [Candidatus Cloacimonadota bacterium]